MRRSVLAVGLLTVCLAGGAKGQTVVPARDTLQPKPRCFTGRPLPKCKTFLLTEVGYYHRIVGTEFVLQFGTDALEIDHLDSHFSWDLGLMSNRGPRRAVGGAFHVGVNDAGWRLGLKGRYRQWTGERSAMDLSAGVLRASINGDSLVRSRPAYGVTGDVALGWREWVALTMRADALRGGGRTVGAIYGGVRLGSYPGIAATAVGALFMAIVYISLASEHT